MRYPLKQLFIQSTSFCNLDCKYCHISLDDRENKNFLSIDHLGECLDSIVKYGNLSDSFLISWHLGEPLAAGIKRFKSYLQLIRSHKLSKLANVNISIQTNGTLITDEWCTLLQEYSVFPSISIDGEKKVHDFNRVTKSGNGTHSRIMKNIAKLNERNIKFSLICVVNDQSLDSPIELHDELVSTGACHIMTNVVRSTIIGNAKVKPDFDERVKIFWRELFRHSQKSGTLPLFRDLNFKENNIIQNLPNTVYPLGLLVLQTDGSLSTFSPDLAGTKSIEFGDFTYGHVSENSLEDLLRNKRLNFTFEKILLGVKDCKSNCKLFNVCGGAKVYSRLSEHNDLTIGQTNECRQNIISRNYEINPFFSHSSH